MVIVALPTMGLRAIQFGHGRAVMQDRLLDLLTNLLAIILGGGIVIVVVWWLRHRVVKRSNPLFANAVLREMKLERGSTIIDVGCGTGWASREVARAATDGLVVGIDVSESAVERAQEMVSDAELHGGTNLAYVTANVESLPWRSAGFDHATCIVSFSWFSHPEAALAAMRRILRPGGRLYIADVCKEHVVSRVVTILCNRILSAEEHLYSAEAYRAFVGRHFGNVRQDRLSPLGGLWTVGTRPANAGGSLGRSMP